MAAVLAVLAPLALNAFPANAQSAQEQTSAPAPASQPTPSAAPTDPSKPITPGGQVLFSRDSTTPPEAEPSGAQNPAPPATDSTLNVSDAERTAITFTAYDLDVHLTPASAGISVRAGLTVRNDSAAPLHRLILQITSSMHWDAISSRISPSGPTPLAFTIHQVDTDADHTGRMEEAVVTLPQPLAPGASLTLTALYSGTIQPNAERLTRIGAPASQALAEDWDAIAPNDPDAPANGTALRGFGNVLWYPVSDPPVFLGDGAKLFQAVGRTKLRQSAASIRLRLAVEYVGDPPDAAFFCGQRGQLTAISDNPNVPIAESPGIASAVFDPQPLGFRTPSLFITGHAASDAGTPSHSNLIAAVTGHDEAIPVYSAAATLVEPLLVDWFGPEPLTSLTILDHPGQPFEDDALLVHPMSATDPERLAPPLAHSLTHAWIRSSHPWIDEGWPNSSRCCGPNAPQAAPPHSPNSRKRRAPLLLRNRRSLPLRCPPPSARRPPSPQLPPVRPVSPISRLRLRQLRPSAPPAPASRKRPARFSTAPRPPPSGGCCAALLAMKRCRRPCKPTARTPG